MQLEFKEFGISVTVPKTGWVFSRDAFKNQASLQSVLFVYQNNQTLITTTIAPAVLELTDQEVFNKNIEFLVKQYNNECKITFKNLNTDDIVHYVVLLKSVLYDVLQVYFNFNEKLFCFTVNIEKHPAINKDNYKENSVYQTIYSIISSFRVIK